jgi:hypothetical protein
MDRGVAVVPPVSPDSRAARNRLARRREKAIETIDMTNPADNHSLREAIAWTRHRPRGRNVTTFNPFTVLRDLERRYR